MELPIKITEITYHDKRRGEALVKTNKRLVVGEDYIVSDENYNVNFNYKWRCVKDTSGLYRIVSHQVDTQRLETHLVSSKFMIELYETANTAKA